MTDQEKRARRPQPGGIGEIPALVRFSEPDDSSCRPEALPLDFIEKRASDFLMENGFSPGTFVAGEEGFTFASSWPSDDVRDAQLNCRWLRHAIQHQLADAAAKYAFTLATLLANNKLMSEWRRIAPLAEHGNTMLQGQGNLTPWNEKRRKQKEPEWQRYKAAAEPIRKQNPLWTKRRIARHIFETLQPPPKGKGELQDSSIMKRIERHI
jgi:hypothetical protein